MIGKDRGEEQKENFLLYIYYANDQKRGKKRITKKEQGEKKKAESETPAFAVCLSHDHVKAT